MTRQVMGMGIVYKDEHGNEVIDHVEGNNRRRVGGLVEAVKTLSEKERVIGAGQSISIPLTGDEIVEDITNFGQYNIAISVKGNPVNVDPNFGKDSLFVRTSWRVHDFDISDYAQARVDVDEEIKLFKNSNFVTKRQPMQSDTMTTIRIENLWDEEITVVVQMYGHTAPSKSDFERVDYVDDFYIPTNPLKIEEIDIESNENVNIPIGRLLTNFSEYNIGISVKNNPRNEDPNFDENMLFIRTSWTLHRHEVSDYVGARVDYEEKVELSKNSNFLTFRQVPRSDDLREIRIQNKWDQGITVVVQLYGYKNTSGAKDVNIETNGSAVDIKQQYIVDQNYFQMSGNESFTEYPRRIDIDKPCYIQSLFVSDIKKDATISLKINGYESTDYVRAYSHKTLTYENLNEIGGENDLMKLTTYSESDNVYTMILKQPIYCPLGFTFKVGNENDNTGFGQVSVVYFNEVVK